MENFDTSQFLIGVARLLKNVASHINDMMDRIEALTKTNAILRDVLRKLAIQNDAARTSLAECISATETSVKDAFERADMLSDEVKLATQFNPQCVVCASSGVTHAIFHNETAHLCLCVECAMTLKKNSPVLCPICRDQGTLVRVFVSGKSPYLHNVNV